MTDIVRGFWLFNDFLRDESVVGAVVLEVLSLRFVLPMVATGSNVSMKIKYVDEDS